MQSLRNKVQLIGNLGNNPEVKELKKGVKLARFSVATNEKFRNSEGKSVTETQWHQIVAWGKNAVLAEKYLEKGRTVAIEGKLTYRSYTGKDGQNRYLTEIVADQIVFLQSNR